MKYRASILSVFQNIVMLQYFFISLNHENFHENIFLAARGVGEADRRRPEIFNSNSFNTFPEYPDMLRSSRGAFFKDCDRRIYSGIVGALSIDNSRHDTSRYSVYCHFAKVWGIGGFRGRG